MSRWGVFILYAIFSIALGLYLEEGGRQIFSVIWTCAAVLTLHWLMDKEGP